MAYAREQQSSDRMYLRWVVSGADTAVSFDDYKKSFVSGDTSLKNKTDILADVCVIGEAMHREVNTA